MVIMWCKVWFLGWYVWYLGWYLLNLCGICGTFVVPLFLKSIYSNVARLYERKLNELSEVFGDAKKARKSISTNEKSFADWTEGKLIG